MFIASTKVSVLSRETTESEWGSPTLTFRVTHTGIPASIVSSLSATTSPETGRQYVVNRVRGQVPHGTPLTDGDRIKDESDGRVYTVLVCSESTIPNFRGPTLLDLERIEV
ncbi:hypothetical protein ACIBSW_34570 [Actinoplanes sp. NPDC049668]|uniref:hypothetical protein n=1 Tax=unclassified Actinoplanes TaxID=2626549 RepID=UPI0033AB678A